jgi:hypothetical protein
MADLIRLSVFGNMPGGEEWSINPVFTLADFGTPISPVQIAAIATACAAVTPPATLTELWNSVTNLAGVRAEARSQTGVLETQAEALRTTVVPGTGTSTHPYQTSACVSLRSAQVGASGRGRLYFPATGVPLTSTTLRMSTSVRDSVLGGAKTYLSGLTTAINATVTGSALIVWSRKTHGRYLVNRIQLGDVVDVQRRRRDALIESYGSLVYP